VVSIALHYITLLFTVRGIIVQSTTKIRGGVNCAHLDTVL